MGHLLHTTLAFFTPESGGSPQANKIDSLYKIELWIALVIFVMVEGALFYALIRFRRKRHAVPAQIRGNTRLEVGWTVGAAVILVALAVITFTSLSSIQNPPNSGVQGDHLVAAAAADEYASVNQKLPPNGKALKIHIIGRQYIWQYVYPGSTEPDGLGAPFSYQELVVPTETTVSVEVTSADVVHSWWIPELGGKVTAVPGYRNYTWFKIPKPGIYRGQCAVLCGRGHARMTATVRAVPPATFDAWLAGRKKQLEEANKAAQEARELLNKRTGAGQVENP